MATSSYQAPKFEAGQKVKFKDDHDAQAGLIESLMYSSENGWTYRIASKVFDPQKGDMVEGVKIGREEELVDMTKNKKED